MNKEEANNDQPPHRNDNDADRANSMAGVNNRDSTRRAMQLYDCH